MICRITIILLKYLIKILFIDDDVVLLNGFEEVPISSTEIRDAVSKGNEEIIKNNIDDRVYRYIKEHKLYK